MSEFASIIFDCDGVLLNSNHIKTQAFYNASKIYGHAAAQALTDYHVKNGGISRYKKFEYFFTRILEKEIQKDELDDLLLHFAEEVKKSLLTCEIAEGLEELRKKSKNAKWLIVSGGDQAELREVFSLRGLDYYFDGGIFGSPDSKDKILVREIENENIKVPCLFIGDSKYDYQSAKDAGLDFLFISQWSEVKGWREWANGEGINCRHSLLGLLD